MRDIFSFPFLTYQGVDIENGVKLSIRITKCPAPKIGFSIFSKQYLLYYGVDSNRLGLRWENEMNVADILKGD